MADIAASKNRQLSILNKHHELFNGALYRPDHAAALAQRIPQELGPTRDAVYAEVNRGRTPPLLKLMDAHETMRQSGAGIPAIPEFLTAQPADVAAESYARTAAFSLKEPGLNRIGVRSRMLGQIHETATTQYAVELQDDIATVPGDGYRNRLAKDAAARLRIPVRGDALSAIHDWANQQATGGRKDQAYAELAGAVAETAGTYLLYLRRAANAQVNAVEAQVKASIDQQADLDYFEHQIPRGAGRQALLDASAELRDDWRAGTQALREASKDVTAIRDSMATSMYAEQMALAATNMLVEGTQLEGAKAPALGGSVVTEQLRESRTDHFIDVYRPLHTAYQHAQLHHPDLKHLTRYSQHQDYLPPFSAKGWAQAARRELQGHSQSPGSTEQMTTYIRTVVKITQKDFAEHTKDAKKQMEQFLDRHASASRGTGPHATPLYKDRANIYEQAVGFIDRGIMKKYHVEIAMDSASPGFQVARVTHEFEKSAALAHNQSIDAKDPDRSIGQRPTRGGTER